MAELHAIEEGMTLLLREVHVNEENFDRDSLLSIADNLLQCSLLVETVVVARASPELQRIASLIRSDIHQIRDALLVVDTSREYRGRPRISVSFQQIIHFFEYGFSNVAIAQMFGCSVRTVERRLEEVGLTKSDLYSNISHNELVRIVRELSEWNPNLGEKSIDGILRSRNILVQRHKIRDALHAVDPEGVRYRLKRALHRRIYNVFGPNHLWHIDGYHKLIRWKIVVHGGIDGYSRLIVYLEAATNNRADTTLAAFLKAVEIYGVPSRVRSDQGGENIMIADYMIGTRGEGRGSMIVGKSVHNQRIERLWRDLFSGCISFYYYLFYSMEDADILNPDSNIDIYTIHMVFLSKIQHHLNQFRHGWCNHKLRTERNKSPMQLWMLGTNYNDNEENEVYQYT